MSGDPIVIPDVGKALAKRGLWTRNGEMVARETRPNVRCDAGAYVAPDAEGIEQWVAETLGLFARKGKAAAIFPVGMAQPRWSSGTACSSARRLATKRPSRRTSAMIMTPHAMLSRLLARGPCRTGSILSLARGHADRAKRQFPILRFR